MVVILAAGKGSRMGLKEGVSKCAVPLPGSDQLTSVSRLINQFYLYGHREFVVVIGYGGNAVAITTEVPTGANVHFVYNPCYLGNGCGYSVACGASLAPSYIKDTYNMIIVEGDTVTSNDNIKYLCTDQKGRSTVLCRSSEYLSDRSVAVLADQRTQRVLRFIYDQKHKFDFKNISNVDCFYDSCQMWKFSYADALLISEKFNEYKLIADQNPFGAQDSGVFVINQNLFEIDMKARECAKPEEWINLNTKEDFDKLANLSWYGAE